MADNADILRAFHELQALPDGLHWFCPRENDGDTKIYFAEDLAGNPHDFSEEQQRERAQKIKDAKTRQSKVLTAVQIFAYDGKDAEGPQNLMEDSLAKQMKTCDICIREFHRARKDLKLKLEDAYDEEDVAVFLTKFDDMNLKRIEGGLASATKQLEELPKEKRLINVLDRAAIHAIFEAFNCVPFHTDEVKLSLHFDKFFHLVQTNKFLKLSSYSPAMFFFLFGRDGDRAFWANRALQKFQRQVTPEEFEFCVKDALLDAIGRVQLYALEKEYLQQFWNGARLIVERLDKSLVTHSLRALDADVMEVDLCRLAFSHLQVDDNGFKNLLATIRRILEVSPTDFWEAMGTVSAAAWTEQFFGSTAFRRLLLEAETDKTATGQALDALFSWISPFMESVKPMNRTPSCRKFVDQLLRSLQDQKYGEEIRNYCLKLGVKIMNVTLIGLNQIELSKILGPTTTEALDIASSKILTISDLTKDGTPIAVLAAEVVQQAIYLDCRCLVGALRSINLETTGSKTAVCIHESLWTATTRRLGQNNVTLAAKALSGLNPLAGTDKHVSKDGLSEGQIQFNKALDSVNTILIDWLERIGEFTVDDLKNLFQEPNCIQAIFSLIFSPNRNVSSAAVELMKAASGTSTRLEAFEFLLRNFFATGVDALCRSLHQIELMKTFTPSASVLKPSSDIVEILCNSQNGLLRSENISDKESKATERLWQGLWRLLTMIFSSTEAWSISGHDKNKLMDFCRDTMEFADKLFDQFGVLRGALERKGIESTESVGINLIEKPKTATNVSIKWLKLRDDRLVSKACALVCKLLIRLKEFDVQLPEETLQFIVDIATDASRNTLSQQQKAELFRALEKHSGAAMNNEHEAEIQMPEREKKVIDLTKWTNKASTMTSNRTAGAPAKPTTSAAPSYEKFKAMQNLQKPTVGSSAAKGSAAPSQDPSEFRKKREREMAEKKRRDALALAQHKKRAGYNGSLAGEGPGMRNLGVQGKVHDVQPKGTGMMVSSSDESSDHDEPDEFEKEFFGGKATTAPRTNGITKEQAKALKQQNRGPVKKQRLVRSTRDMRARLAPDLSALHKSLLNWEYFHEGAFPPNSTAEDYSFVQNSFRDPYGYQRVFQPLLILEAWNGFLKAREENVSKPYSIKVVMRSTVDAFLEVSSTASHEDAKEIAEGDIILLSQSNPPTSSPSSPHCLSRIHRISRKKAHVEIVYRTVPGTKMAPVLGEGAAIFGLKIMSVIPLEREYGALLGLQYYDLCDEITKAKPSPLLNYSDEKLNPLMENYGINKAQSKAVKCALDNDAFTLVQGPPGSGKTKTIVAITGAILSDSLKQGITMISQPSLQGQHPGQGHPPPRKLLVCAPSNAAVDELVMRFKAGVRTLSGEDRTISIVRLGRSDAINSNVQDVTLDELVNKRLNTSSNNGRADTQKIMEEHRIVSEKLRQARTKLDEAEAQTGATKDLKEEFESLRRQKTLLGQKVDSAKDNEEAQSRQADFNRRKAQQEVLDGAHVICATLSGSGHDMFQNLNIEFETVIIDEAAQCVELSALIPLKYGCAKCILVGDPQQLPPTVFSKEAARFKYEQSLFVRMQANHPEDIHLLDTQYRMHPEISAFPSKAFYDSRLLDGKDMAALRSRSWHETELLSPFRFFDVQGQHQSATKGHSLINMAEVRVAKQLYTRLTSDFGNLYGKIGIITPYKSQLRELREQFKREFGPSITEAIEFNTTDAFQGRESEVIIFSCVRASPAGGIGFLQDIRRMNVGLTRAMSSLWVLGNSESLSRGEFWSKLVEDARSRQRYTTGDVQKLLSRPLKATTNAKNGPGNVKTIEMENSRPSAMEIDPNPVSNKEHAISRRGLNLPSDQRESSVPAKRKHSEDENMSTPTSSSSSKSSYVSSSDVEMGDAPPIEVDASLLNSKAPPSTKQAPAAPNSQKSNGAASEPASKKPNVEPAAKTPRPPSDALPPGQISTKPAPQETPKPPAGARPAAQKPAATEPTPAAPRPNVPQPPRKKKEVDIFMKKKPRT